MSTKNYEPETDKPVMPSLADKMKPFERQIIELAVDMEGNGIKTMQLEKTVRMEEMLAFPPRGTVIYELDSFDRWLEANAVPKLDEVYWTKQRMVVTRGVDLSGRLTRLTDLLPTPLRDTVTLTWRKHRDLQDLEKSLKIYRQKEFVDFLKRCRTVVNIAELIETYGDISTSIVVERAAKYDTANQWSVMFKSATGAGNGSQKMLPKTMTARVRMLEGDEPDNLTEFVIDIYILEPENAEQPCRFELVCRDVDEYFEDRIRDEVEKLQSGHPEIPFYHGEF